MADFLAAFLVRLLMAVAGAEQAKARVTLEAYIRAKREAERIEEERGLK
jgi:hypothetical protein